MKTRPHETVALEQLVDAVYDIAARANLEPRVASALAARTLARMPCVPRATAMLLPARSHANSTHQQMHRRAKKDSP